MVLLRPADIVACPFSRSRREWETRNSVPSWIFFLIFGLHNWPPPAGAAVGTNQSSSTELASKFLPKHKECVPPMASSPSLGHQIRSSCWVLEAWPFTQNSAPVTRMRHRCSAAVLRVSPLPGLPVNVNNGA